ncbi:MAG: Zn-ribbon domain-containing OB-fold protein [Comamonas sp.]
MSSSAATPTTPTLPQPEKEYLQFLARGEFRIQRSRSTGRHVFYPRVAAPVTGKTDLEWVAPSGRGTVYAVTVINQKPPAQPYNVVLVDLAEGPRLLSRVDGIAPQDVRIGMAVQAQVIEEEGKPLVVFTPIQ